MHKKIHITYLIDALGTGGAQTHVLNVLRNIDYKRFDVRLICVRRAGMRFDQLDDYPVERLVLDLENLMNPLATLRGLRTVRKFLRQSHTDILHAYMFNPTIMAAISKILYGKGVKLITSRRDVGYWHQSHHWSLYRLINRITDKVVAVTEDVRQTSIHKEKLDPAKVVTIYNGIDTDYFSPQEALQREIRAELGIGDEILVVGMLAVLRPEKRHDLFVMAAERIKQVFPNVRFLVVGGGYTSVSEQIQALLSKLGLTDDFIFTGKVTDSRRWLSAFDVSVLCSDTEGMSNTLLESLSMGLPVVATKVGGNPEVIDEARTGLLVPPGDHDALAEAVLKLIQDKSLRITFAENSRHAATERFSVRKMTEHMQQVYEELLGLNSPE